MRLFVAIDLDETARRAVAEEQRRIARTIEAAGPRAMRWVLPEGLHLTLVFLGEVATGLIPALAEALGTELALDPFTITLTGLGVFPPRGAPRTLWIGLREGSEQTVTLQRQTVDRVVRAGIHVEERPYHPHLTLARWRTSRPADRRRGLAADGHREVARVEVDHITLYQSRLSAAGSTYHALARATLASCRSSSSRHT